MELTGAYITQRLEDKFGDAVGGFEEPYGMLSFTAAAARNIDVLRFLYEDPELHFRFLTDLTAVHFPERSGEELSVVYHLHNMRDNVRLRLRIFTAIADPVVNSATVLFASANWMERETYDFFGVRFAGHPNLKRILNVEEMDYFPLRKEYPLEDQTRIDKDDAMFGRADRLLGDGEARLER